MRVNTNISALQSERGLKRATSDVQESSVKLSSGERINKAADDAAGLAISEKIRAEVRSSRQANRNANDGISLVQTAEGGLNETSGILTRMRELAIQAATDTLGGEERAMTDKEYQGLKSELERISQVTEFNGRKLLDGSSSQLDFQVGTGANSDDDHISVRPSEIKVGLSHLGLMNESITTKLSAQQGLGRLDQAINKISGARSILGSLQNRLVSSSNNLQIYNQNMSEANSRIRDTDYAAEAAIHAKESITQAAATSTLAQANISGKMALKLV
jgi:flagellin